MAQIHDLKSAFARSHGPIMGLTERGLHWLYASARLWLITHVRRNPMHPAVPELVIAVREMRP